MNKNPILIDTHAHINFKDFKNDAHRVIKRALKNNIWLINVGSQYSTSKRAVKYVQKYKTGVFAAVGLHPNHVSTDDKKTKGREYEEFDSKKYEELLKNHKVVAVGEIGLDFEENITDDLKEKQKQVFMEQVDLACRNNKAIIFHCRKAYDEMIELLTMFNYGCASCPHACVPKPRGVFHCFVGRLSQAQKLMELGDYYFGFNGIITYARDYDKVIKGLPLERIILETDCPYLAPLPHRNERNEPSYVKFVAEKIAEIKGVSFEEVAKQTTENTRKLFGI